MTLMFTCINMCAVWLKELFYWKHLALFPIYGKCGWGAGIFVQNKLFDFIRDEISSFARVVFFIIIILFFWLAASWRHVSFKCSNFGQCFLSASSSIFGFTEFNSWHQILSSSNLCIYLPQMDFTKFSWQSVFTFELKGNPFQNMSPWRQKNICPLP